MQIESQEQSIAHLKSCMYTRTNDDNNDDDDTNDDDDDEFIYYYNYILHFKDNK